MSKETYTYMKRSTLRRVFGSCILSHDILFVSMVLKICRKRATHVRKEMYAKNFAPTSCRMISYIFLRYEKYVEGDLYIYEKQHIAQSFLHPHTVA